MAAQAARMSRWVLALQLVLSVCAHFHCRASACVHETHFADDVQTCISWLAVRGQRVSPGHELGDRHRPRYRLDIMLLPLTAEEHTFRMACCSVSAQVCHAVPRQRGPAARQGTLCLW